MFTLTVLGLFTSLTTTCCMIHWSTARYIGVCLKIVKSFFIQLWINDPQLCPFANNLPVYCTLLSKKNNSHFPIHIKFIINQWFLWIMPFLWDKNPNLLWKIVVIPTNVWIVRWRPKPAHSISGHDNLEYRFFCHPMYRLDSVASGPSPTDACLV